MAKISSRPSGSKPWIVRKAEKALLDELEKEIEALPHYTCEDCWYSCPEATGDDACCDDRGTGCRCWKATVLVIIQGMREARST